MTSFNHYAFGAIGDWLHRVVAGLAPAEPGYRVLEIAPVPLDGLEFAAAEHLTPYGRARAGWRRDGDAVVVTATVPPNTTARVTLPDGATHEVGSGDHTWTAEVPVGTGALAPVGLHSSLAAIIDDPQAYRVVIDAIAEHSPAEAEQLRLRTKWLPDRDLAEALSRRVGPEVRQAVAERLAELDAERGAA